MVGYVDELNQSAYRVNRQDIPVGNVDYFVQASKSDPYHKEVSAGIVDEHYIHSVALKLIDVRDRRIINGIPIKDLTFPTKPQKLPKKWSCTDDLCKIEYEEPSHDYDFTNPDDILRALEDDYLVYVQDRDYACIESEIDKKEGWWLKRVFHYYDPPHPSYMDVHPDNVFETYAEAAEVKEKINKEIDDEFARQAALSYYEWAVEKIDRELDRFAKFCNASDSEKKQCRDWLLAKDNVEDIEVRLSRDGLQWKYCDNKKWLNIGI